jgi:hypothetical protein
MKTRDVRWFCRESLHIEARVGFGVGISLFVVGMGLALKRAGGVWRVLRMIAMAITVVAIVFVADVDAYLTVVIGLVGLVVIGVVERLHYGVEVIDTSEESVVDIGV